MSTGVSNLHKISPFIQYIFTYGPNSDMFTKHHVERLPNGFKKKVKSELNTKVNLMRPTLDF